MRIAFITYEFPPASGKGGIGTYTRQMAIALAAKRWDVHVFSGCSTPSATYVEDGYHLHLSKCENGNDFRHKVVKSFSDEQAINPFDLIESPEINGNAWEVKKKYPTIPLIVRLHAPNYLVETLKKKYIPFFAKLRFVMGSIRRLKFDLGYWRPYDKTTDQDYQFIQIADFITAPSFTMKNWVVKNWKIPVDKITIIPNLFLPPPALLNIPIEQQAKYKKVIFFGRLNALKGLINVTKAMKVILKQYPAWHFKVIGDDGTGPANGVTMRKWMKEELKNFLGQVEFLDGVLYEELPAAIAASEIVLLPSLFESFSYTCAEAMAAGKAVVGSDNTGMADLIQQDKSGMLVNPYEYREIVTAIKKLIEDNDFREQVSTMARIRIVNDFNAQYTLKLFMAFYKEAIVA